MPKRSNLIITKVGKGSLHPNWLKGGPRNFDLLVVAYDLEAMPDANAAPIDGVRYLYLPLHKIVGLSHLFAQMPELVETYEYIALIDDDIDTDAATLSACFDEGRALDLLIWQPSLSWNSYISFGGLLQHPSLNLRYVNFIEMMCPFFQSAYLKKAIPLLSLGYEVGPDLIWCSLTDRPAGRFAIIDKFSIHHTRPIGLKKATNGFANKTYEDDIHACLTTFGMQWPSLVSHRAIKRGGRPLNSQFQVALLSLTLLGAIFSAKPGERFKRLRYVLTYIKHQFTRKPTYGRAEDISARLAELVPTTPVESKQKAAG